MAFIDTIPECTIVILLKRIRPCRFDQALALSLLHLHLHLKLQ